MRRCVLILLSFPYFVAAAFAADFEKAIRTAQQNGTPPQPVSRNSKGGKTMSSGAAKQLGSKDEFLNDRKFGKGSTWVAAKRPPLRQNIDLFAGKPFTEAKARAALHAYYACVTYMDAQLGRVLDALQKNGLRDNTIIVFWGDHGWHLSDKGMWAKGTLFETSARGPLLIADPRQRATAGQTSPRIVQYLDMYPTLVEPHEMRNLATDSAHKETVAKLQQQLRESKVGQSMRRDGNQDKP